jgi:hypothetical protein
MPDPNPHDMLTRIEILERRVETLERAAKFTRRHNSPSGILPAVGGLRTSEAARERGIAELPVSWAKRLPRLVPGRRTPELWHSLLGFLVGRSRPSQRSEPSR